MTTHFSPQAGAQELVAYACPLCGRDSARTELDAPPFCRPCGQCAMIEVKREPYTQEAFFRRVRRVADRIMENLEETYTTHRRKNPYDDDGELLLLTALAQGQGVQRMVRRVIRWRAGEERARWDLPEHL